MFKLFSQSFIDNTNLRGHPCFCSGANATITGLFTTIRLSRILDLDSGPEFQDSTYLVVMQILPANPSHIDIIRTIAHDTWPVTYGHIISPEQMTHMLGWMYSEKSLRQQMEEQGHHFLVAMEDGRCYGFASYELNGKKPGTTKIHKLYILPQSQGRGVGSKLVNAIATAALDNNNEVVTLNVNRQNKAVDFYKRIGFSIAGSEDIDIGQGFLMEDYIMEAPSRQLQTGTRPSSAPAH